jgi:hypothetical protein
VRQNNPIITTIKKGKAMKISRIKTAIENFDAGKMADDANMALLKTFYANLMAQHHNDPAETLTSKEFIVLFDMVARSTAELGQLSHAVITELKQDLLEQIRQDLKLAVLSDNFAHLKYLIQSVSFNALPIDLQEKLRNYNSLAMAGILSPENFASLCKLGTYAQNIRYVLHSVNEQVRDIMIYNGFLGSLYEHPEYAPHIAAAVMKLPKNNLKDNIIAIFKNYQRAQGIHSALSALKQHSPEVLYAENSENTQRNITAVIEKAEYGPNIAAAVYTLSAAKSELLTQDNFAIICQHAKHAQAVASAFCALLNAGIYTDENKEAVTIEPENAMAIALNLGGKPLKRDEEAKGNISIKKVANFLAFATQKDREVATAESAPVASRTFGVCR